MLDQDPERRPSVSRLLRHPYIKKQIAKFLEGTKNRYVHCMSFSSHDAITVKPIEEFLSKLEGSICYSKLDFKFVFKLAKSNSKL